MYYFGDYPDLSTMLSINCETYMQTSSFHAPQLKQIECAFRNRVSYFYYIRLTLIDRVLQVFLCKYCCIQNFAEFCRAHPHLERLRLSRSPFIDVFPTRLERIRRTKGHRIKSRHIYESHNILNWCNHQLPMIKALSIHPRIIHCSDHYQNGTIKSTLCKILSEHPSLEELEICPDRLEDIFYEPKPMR